MPRTVPRPLAVLAALALLAGLSGCSGGAGKPVEDYAGEPKGVDAPASSAGGASWAAWLDDGTRFAIVLYGSSSCPPKVQNATAASADRITATLAPAPGGMCTRDYVPHTTVFATPERIRTSSEVTVDLAGTTLTLPALPG